MSQSQLGSNPRGSLNKNTPIYKSQSYIDFSNIKDYDSNMREQVRTKPSLRKAYNMMVNYSIDETIIDKSQKSGLKEKLIKTNLLILF